METKLDDNGYLFSDDGKSFRTFCVQCERVPCVWENNQEEMVNFDKANIDGDAPPNEHRHGLYRQMALIINNGPSGKGNRMKLPECVVNGVRKLFPDPDALYTGHLENE